MYNWNTNIRFVKGVGPAKAKVLNSIKIETVGDLLEYKPLDYLYPGVTKIADLPSEGNVLIRGTIEQLWRAQNRTPIVYAKIFDGSNVCLAVWWNQIYVLQNLRVGMLVTLWGKVKNNRLQQPNFSTCNFKQEEIAGGLYGGKTEIIRGALREILTWKSPMPDWELENYIPRNQAFDDLHKPLYSKDKDEALERLKYDEFFLMQLALGLKRKQQKQINSPTLFGCKPIINRPKVLPYFPYKFTNEQERVIAEISDDMCADKPMHRLLHGEVGSGKTAVAFYAAILTALNEKRALMLCPTTVLAIQHYETLRSMGWDDVGLCIGSKGCDFDVKLDNYKYPHVIYNATNDAPEPPHIFIGTHALFNYGKILKETSLVIVDEQHKFGVEQRAKLQKYGNPHVLLMSATPIPRTLAMTVFGDLDVSTIKELPIKRGTVVTKWVLPDKREQMYEIIDTELAKGKQIYVVYPRIKSGDEDVESAEKGHLELCKRWNKLGIALLTGKYSVTYKAKILAGFKLGFYKILVSTIIAEVGLDNPNATVMVIEGADRFGLSQLHQLRGRICRSTNTTFCFLVAETANETSIKRLEIMEETNDGFEIAEADLKLRGPGEMFSTRQHGLPDLKFANIVDDYDLLVQAKELAGEYVDKLDLPENAGLKEMLQIKYGDTLKLAGIA